MILISKLFEFIEFMNPKDINSKELCIIIIFILCPFAPADEQDGAEEHAEYGGERGPLPDPVDRSQAARPGLHLHGTDAGAAQEVVRPDRRDLAVAAGLCQCNSTTYRLPKDIE